MDREVNVPMLQIKSARTLFGNAQQSTRHQLVRKSQMSLKPQN